MKDATAEDLIKRILGLAERVVCTYEGRPAFDKEQQARKGALNERYVAAQEKAAASMMNVKIDADQRVTTDAPR